MLDSSGDFRFQRAFVKALVSINSRMLSTFLGQSTFRLLQSSRYTFPSLEDATIECMCQLSRQRWFYLQIIDADTPKPLLELLRKHRSQQTRLKSDELTKEVEVSRPRFMLFWAFFLNESIPQSEPESHDLQPKEEHTKAFNVGKGFKDHFERVL